MADLRERVVDDRGLIAKIQAYIPGFNGYREKDDLKVADNMLRIQIADKLSAARTEIEACRPVLAKNLGLDRLESLGALIARFKTVDGEIRNAAQGYSGISAKIQVQQANLNQLYDYDLALMKSVDEVGAEAAKLKGAISAKDSAATEAEMTLIDAKLTDIEIEFKKRMAVITNTEA